jgi:hypothetical protein
VLRKTRSRITGREGNRPECVINLRKFSESRRLRDRFRHAGRALAFTAQDRVQFAA